MFYDLENSIDKNSSFNCIDIHEFDLESAKIYVCKELNMIHRDLHDSKMKPNMQNGTDHIV